MSPADAIALPFIERDFETPSYDRKLALDRIRSREYKARRKARCEMEKMHHMDYECKKPSAEKLKEYREFMFNPDNIENCAECPERGNNNRGFGLPCGQQNCWVRVHCK